MPPKYKFADGEKVLCYHGPLLYEAKVSKTREKNPQFFIHYGGWNKTWDEWVPESRLIKHNEAGLQKQKELQALHPDKKRPTKKRERPRRDIETVGSRRKRTRQEHAESATREMSADQDIKVELPGELRKWLVDDWDLVTKQKQLVRIPKKVTVVDILAKYTEHVESSDPEKSKGGQIQEVCDGIREYFNAMLGSQLLYKFERLQYAEILEAHKDKQMAELYGVEHLLRLFVRLGPMLSHTPMDEESVALLLSHIQDFVSYLEASKELFSMEYDAAPQEYHRRMAG